jgi:uncharacterized phage-associated protein
MYGSFDLEKTMQAVAVLLKTDEQHKMSFIRLLKLLYIANRESIRETGYPIVDDKTAAMDHGPVMSHTYDCLKEKAPEQERWSQHFQTSGNHFVRLIRDPGDSALSEYDEALLLRVADQYLEWEDYEIAKLTHSFPEYTAHKPPEGRSRSIPVRDILEAVGLGSAAADLIKDHRAQQNMLRSLSRAK